MNQLLNLVPVVQMLDNAIHRINCYPVDIEVLTKQTTRVHYPLNGVLLIGCVTQISKSPGKVYKRSASIVHYPLNGVLFSGCVTHISKNPGKVYKRSASIILPYINVVSKKLVHFFIGGGPYFPVLRLGGRTRG